HLLVRDADIKSGLRGKGYGVRAYEALIRKAHEHGLTFGSDTHVSEQAQRVYDALERRGHVVKRNPAERQASGELISNSEMVPAFEIAPPKYFYRGRKTADSKAPIKSETPYFAHSEEAAKAYAQQYGGSVTRAQLKLKNTASEADVRRVADAHGLSLADE